MAASLACFRVCLSQYGVLPFQIYGIFLCVFVFQCFWATSPWCCCCCCCWLAGSIQRMESPTSWCTWESAPCWEASPCRAVKDWVWLRRRCSVETRLLITELCSSSCACWEFFWSASSPSSPSLTEPWSASAPTCSRPCITSRSRPRSSSLPPSCLKSGKRSVLWIVWVFYVDSPRYQWEWYYYVYLRKPCSRGLRTKRKRSNVNPLTLKLISLPLCQPHYP